MSETTPQEVPTRLLLESSNTTDTPQQTFRAGIERDRPFRIHAQTIGDVMYQVHEQLRLRGIRRTLPTLSISILWLMLELLDTEVLELENRMIVEVSQGYLHEQTGRAHTTQRTTGHISRALKALMEAGIVSVLVRVGAMRRPNMRFPSLELPVI